MTFRDKFKAHVVEFREMTPDDFGKTFNALKIESDRMVPMLDKIPLPEALEMTARLAAAFYFAGELIERITGEDAAP